MKYIDAKGAHIPVIGLGTWTLRGGDCARLVEEAIRLGYRHIDTAQMYGNERDVGEGIRASGIRREDIFLVTKIQPENLAPQLLKRSAKGSVDALKLGEVDLLLLHWPNKGVPLKDTIEALVEVQQQGLTRHIGVSNYTTALIEEASRLSGDRLVCDQVEMHPFLDQTKVIAACRKHDMAVVAYSPIAKGDTKNDAVLTRIGKTHGKSSAQVSLRYLIQAGVAAIPRTSRVERLAENIAIFDFELSVEEMRAIAALARRDGRLTDWAWSPKWDE